MHHPGRATVAVVATVLLYRWLDVPAGAGATAAGLLVGWLWIALRGGRPQATRHLSDSEIVLLHDD